MTGISKWTGRTNWTVRLIKAMGEAIDQGLTAERAARKLGIHSRCAATSKARALGWRFGQTRTPEQRAARPWEQLPQERLDVPRQPKTRRTVTVDVDEETHGQIRQRAEAEGCSYARVVRELIEWGLMADEGPERKRA